MEGYKAAGGPTTELDVHIGEHNMECIQPTDVDLRKVRILANSGGQGTKLKVDMREIYSLGYI